MKLSEGSKLIGVNHVKLGDVVPSALAEPSHMWIRAGEPYAIFRFKHRPADVLQAIGVMPSVSPSRRLLTPPADSYPRIKPAARPESTKKTGRKRPRIKEEKEDVKPSTKNPKLSAKRRRIQAEIAAEEAEAAAHQARAAFLRTQLEEEEEEAAPQAEDPS